MKTPHTYASNPQGSGPTLGDAIRCSNTASECSTARTVSTATDLKYCKSDSDSNRSVSHSEKHHSNTSLGNNYKLIPNRCNEKCASNLLNTENDDNVSRVSKVSNCFPKIDIGGKLYYFLKG
ncbi:unnamed protein product [Schistosoma mattheei]|uniref:Uncharacterized protein n=1 Tax=Schistosoma mattheei TaxID=31246 RepID=A0A183NJ68_9TREM|nr:unnamed protein product [Schistosoma mattheei]